MLGKLSSSSNDSLIIGIKLPLDVLCFTNKPNCFVFVSFNMVNIVLLLPLSLLILYRGLHQKQKDPSSSSSSSLTSHSDVFTYHLALMELIAVSGCIFNICAIYTNNLIILMVGVFLFSFTYIGELSFHILTCLERHLAVVHPIIYLRLKKERGIRIRNISISSAWLLSLLGMGLLSIEQAFVTMNFILITLALILVSLCSLSVLHVLIRPGPGGRGGGRRRVSKSKQRAFYTIIAILGVLLLRFVWDLIWAVLFTAGDGLSCVLITCNLWLKLPSSLLLPLLFLHRTGKLPCCKK